MTKVYNPITDKTTNYITHDFFHKNIIGRIIFSIKNLHIIKILFNALLNTSISRIFIKGSIIKNHINMIEYENNQYTSFNQFNKRILKPNRRQISKELISIADSILLANKIKVSDMANISNIIKDKNLANEYRQGTYLLFKINRCDYRHFIFIDDGVIKNQYFVPHTLKLKYNKDFELCDYDRTITLMKTKNYDQIVSVEFNNYKNYQITNFKKGQEKGYFLTGSSYILLLFKKNIVEIDKLISDNSKNNIYTCVSLGAHIGKKIIK